MQTVYVKPIDGGRVRQPERSSRVMAAAGDTVPRNSYYTRLILAGDLVECQAPVKVAVKPAAQAEAGPVVEELIPQPTTSVAAKVSPPPPPLDADMPRR
jgi:hypothetical protein